MGRKLTSRCAATMSSTCPTQQSKWARTSSTDSLGETSVREPSPYFIQRRPAQEPALESDFAPSFFEDEGTKIDLWLYWRLIRKHSRLIAGVTAGAVFV